jgi:tRNA(Ile)-lysidine synthase
MAFEEAARQARYAFLSQVAESAGALAVAVGHNAGDQAETVLMHFLRGSGLAGLRGMLPKTPLTHYRLHPSTVHGGQSPAASRHPPASNLHLIRPLLEVTRPEIEAYCRRHGLAPRFDRSNLDTTHYRNWLRHEVLPLLSQHNPNVQGVMRRSARVIADEYELLRSLLAETWPQVVVDEAVPGGGLEMGAGGRIAFDLAAWRALPLALQRSSLREAIHRLRRSLRNINFVHVENAVQVATRGSTGDQATLPRGLCLTVGYDRLIIADTGSEGPLPNWPLLTDGSGAVSLLVPGDTPLPGSAWRLLAAVIDPSELSAGWEENKDPWLAYLDAKAAGGRLALRARRPGDRFQPLGMGGQTVKLADFYTNQKVPRAARQRLPLLVRAGAGSGTGNIVWVCGWRVDERAKITDRTEQVLVVQLMRAEAPETSDRGG